MRVKDVMTRGVASVSPQTSVAEALATMTGARLSGLPVIDEGGSLVGIVSEADFLRRSELGTQKPQTHWLDAIFRPGKAAEIYARAHARRIDEIMTRDVATVEETDSLDEAVSIMEKRGVRRLPVLREGKVVGILTRADFVRALSMFMQTPTDQQPVSDDEIKQRIEAELQAQAWAPVATTEVSVAQGVVTLRGVLTEEKERAAIRALIENVAGVRAVEDQMTWIEPFSGTPMN